MYVRDARAYVKHIFNHVPLHDSLQWRKVEILPTNEYEPTAVALAIILHSLFFTFKPLVSFQFLSLVPQSTILYDAKKME